MSARQSEPARGKARFPSPPGAGLLAIAATFLVVFFGSYQLLERHLLARAVPMNTLHLLHLVRGVTAALLLAAVVAIYLMRQPATALQAPELALDFATADRESRRRQHLRWFIQVRWVAAAFSFGLVLIAVPLTGMLPPQTLPLLLGWCSALVVANLFFTRQARRGGNVDRQVLVQIATDLLVLTGLLNASGGLENPLQIAYLFHVIIAGILLPKRKVVVVTFFAGFLVTALAVGELLGVLPHFTFALFPHQHAADDHDHGALLHASLDPVFVAGRTLPFLGVLFLTAYFTTLVSERLRSSEAALERAATTAILEHRRLEGVVDATDLGILVTAADGTVQWCNPRAAAWLGWDEPPSARPMPHLHPAAPCPACLAERTVRTGQPGELERPGRAAGDSPRIFRHVTSAIRGEDGKVLQVVQLIEDITRRKALEAEALHAGKLSVLGQMAAGVAHEIGNPLSSLDARLQLMRRRPGDTAFIEESLQVLKSQIDRIGRIVHGVSHFARSRREEWTDCDLNAVVEEAVKLVGLDRRAQAIELRTRLARGLPAVRGVKDQLLQVVLNLLLNGAEAMPSGGVLDVATEAREEGVSVSIGDSGEGIAEEVREHLFEPFVTTKIAGTGLGLSISYSLVHAHGGSIQVASEPRRGARFTVVLPAAGAAAASEEA